MWTNLAASGGHLGQPHFKPLQQKCGATTHHQTTKFSRNTLAQHDNLLSAERCAEMCAEMWEYKQVTNTSRYSLPEVIVSRAAPEPSLSLMALT